MLDARGYTVLLYAFNVRHDHCSRQAGVFAHVFEVSSVERCAVDVHARSEQDVLASIQCLLADAFTVEERHVSVPCSGKTGQRRERRAAVVGPSGLLPFVPLDLGTYAVRTIGAP